MKYIHLILATPLISFLFIHCKPENKAATEPIKLFQQNASDWSIQGNAGWQFVNDELVGKLDSGSGFVITNKIYNDFILELEFNPDSTINSGVFVRCDSFEMTPIVCHEINIWDLHPNQDFRTGSIVTKVKPFAKVETINKWNTYKIKCKSDVIQVWVNDILTAEYVDGARLKGYIGLQAAGSGEAKFRNIAITEYRL